MLNYRVNKNTFSNPRGDNEVHNSLCSYYYQLTNFEDLGKHENCDTAVRIAKTKGYKADGCRMCSEKCHIG